MTRAQALKLLEVINARIVLANEPLSAKSFAAYADKVTADFLSMCDDDAQDIDASAPNYSPGLSFNRGR